MNLECGFSLHPPSWAQLTPSRFRICTLQHQIRGALGGKQPCVEMPPQAASAAGLFTESGCDCHLSGTSRQPPPPPQRMAMTPSGLLRRPLFQGQEACWDHPSLKPVPLTHFTASPNGSLYSHTPAGLHTGVCQLSRKPQERASVLRLQKGKFSPTSGDSQPMGA